MTVTDHGLVCPDDFDYSAVALYMQTDALATDAALDAVSDAFDTHYTHPYVIGYTTASVNASTLGEQNIGIFNWAILASNMTASTAASFGLRLTIGKTGFYNYGLYANLVAVGAITALSRRNIICQAVLSTSGSTTLLDQTVWRTNDTSTGGEFLVAGGGQFYATAGQTIDLNAYFSHTNAASNVSANAPSRLWCHYMGSGVEIGSA